MRDSEDVDIGRYSCFITCKCENKSSVVLRNANYRLLLSFREQYPIMGFFSFFVARV